ncbi:acetoacetate decarboxylase family protein [Rhodococcus sp. ARC_M8]|uniref:acetoacetate decarboxylase family protein n=1 Tax=Rhodococcus sp. ARC_M8 TaxID=2928853 RepID=UPI001FB24205|nr:acetoacetate decarboxylase family protein [Rhodococcus sp. ARC_M8]MCJ0949971.1 acetoacetate decarboxylase family protein [Rhodococcus sp. ARC_M8]
MTVTTWANRSFTAPFTATGRAATMPAPPWHFAGWTLNVEFEFEASTAEPFVPPAAGKAVGVGAVHFGYWQASTDGRELLDPVLSQYRETFVVLQIERPDGSQANYCPFIWVDQGTSLVRGLLQGLPKKLGSTWLTRSLPIEHPSAAPLRAESKMGASLAVQDRRLIEARAELTGAAGQPLGFMARPTIGAVGWADLRKSDEYPELTFIRADVRDRVEGGWYEATATLDVLPHPNEEIANLGGITATNANVGSVGFTVVGAISA